MVYLLWMLWGIILILIILLILMFINAKLVKKDKLDSFEQINFNDDFKLVYSHLSEAIKFKTVSCIENKDQFLGLHEYLRKTYSLVYKSLEVEVINEYSLLYHWRGANTYPENPPLKPILLTSHLDVVSIEEGTEKDWDLPPFSGEIKDGYLYGRGTLDIKLQVIAILESVENLISNGISPKRDIYLAFGHDEEIGGQEGALKIAKILKDRGIEIEFLLDEGGCVTEGSLDGVEEPIGVIGVAEKGFVNVKLTSKSKGGHASMPSKRTAVGVLSEALVKLEKNQMKLNLTKTVKEMLLNLCPYMKGLNKIVIANINLLAPLFKIGFSSFPAGNAMLRTTTAITMLKGSSAPNVLPQSAEAIINFRLLPGDDTKALIRHIKKVINNEDISIEVLLSEEATVISSTNNYGYNLVSRAAKTVFGEAIITPYLMMAGSDARKYEVLTENIYRFSPYWIKDEDLKRMHGTNERISLENIEKAVKYFTYLIINF